MRDDPLTPARVLQALELFGPQARPYNFDDHFDCWGLVQRVFDWLDDGYDVNEQLLDAGTAAGWRLIADRGDLLPGDLLTTHAQPDEDFHCVFYCGRVGAHDLVYDSSPRALLPLFERHGGELRWVADRGLTTRYMRATETTDRLRNDGGAYLRLWDDRMRYVNTAVHARLQAAGAARERDLVGVRRAAGLHDLPFYCRRRLPRDARGREVYDNLFTRHLDYYIPDGAPVADDDYEAALDRMAAVSGEGMWRGETAAARRPPPPELVDVPPWVTPGGAVRVTWRYPEAAPQGAAPGAGPEAAVVAGCRVELWEETADLWKHRLLREDHDEPRECFDVPELLLHADSRFAVVVYARAAAGFSAGAMTPFLFRPSAANPLLAYNAVRPHGLAPDAGAVVPAGEDVRLSWRIREPVSRHQAKAQVQVFEGGCLDSGEPRVFEALLTGPAAARSECLVPAAGLRGGQDYYWYVMPRSVAGHPAFAPVEGLFTVARGG
jgi:hypothetical protein